jgi:hypothetical protein
MASFDATYPDPSTQGTPTNDSEDHSNHEIPLSQTFHDAQGREYNTATMYHHSGSSHDDDLGSADADRQGQETDRSETPTILASDNDSDHSDTDISPGHPLFSPSPSLPSGSIQYINPCADSEEEHG